MTPTPSADSPADDRAAKSNPPNPADETLGETMFLDSDTSSRDDARRGASRNETIHAAIGGRIGRYEIRGLLGTGGMGVVYRGFDTLIEREVAIKVLPHELSDNSINLQRFLSEAKAAGKLTHPNAVAIFEVGQEGDTYYLVMEYVSGGSVADRMDRAGPLSVLEATRVTAGACRGLAAAHAVGMVHRDIKPANLLYTQDDSVKVADFGLAKQALDQSRNVTQAGKIVGTPYFMSPEQCESRPVDHRSDLYSLGATYYCMLTGMHPYDHLGSVVQVMYAHCNGEILDPRQSDARIPAACSQIIARAMAKRPEDRYQHSTEMLGDLEAVTGTLSGAAIMLPSQSGTHPAANASRPCASSTAGAWTGKPAGKKYGLIGALALAAALLIAGGALFSDWSRPAERDRPGAVAGAHSAALVPVPTGEPIRVGVLHSLSGTMAESESPVVDATLMAIDQLNRAGGVLGRPIKALVRDGRSDPAVFAREAAKLLDEDKVCTVFGCWTSASRKTVVPIFEQRDNLLVYPVQYEGLEQSPNVIYLGATPNQQIVPAVQWSVGFKGKRRFFLVGSDYVFPRAAGAIIRDMLAEMQAELVGEEYLRLGSYDVKPVIEKIMSTRPDVILNTINGSTNIPFFTELRAAGITPEHIPTISFSIGEQELRLFNASEMVGDYAAWNYFQSMASTENREFVERFHQQYGATRVLTDPMEAAYVGVKLWAQAVKQAQSDDVVAIRKAMLDQHIRAPEGDVRIDPSTGHAFKTPRIGQITEDGQFEVIWSGVKPEIPVPFPPSRTPEEWRAFLDGLYVGWGNQWSAPAK